MRLTKHKYLFLVVCCCFTYLYSNGVFSQSVKKAPDGVDETGRQYVLRVIGTIYPDKDNTIKDLMGVITKYGTLLDARKGDITVVYDEDVNGNVIKIDVVCKDETNTQAFFDELKNVKTKKRFSKHYCHNHEYVDGNDSTCYEKPVDIVNEEKKP